MEYGCIGEKLGHSFSREIHNVIADYDYELCEIAREELPAFAERADFSAINVTIPYKEQIIPYLHSIDRHAKMIGAVNTVVNRGGKLYGYNTDFYGMRELARHAGVVLSDKKVVILGTGGTAKTAFAVASAAGARRIVRVSRTAKDDAVDYDTLYSSHTDAEIIINTTPVGMYPNAFSKPVELCRFPSLCGVLDAVYNPLRTPLICEAKRLGVPAEGGLYMLVAQAVRASEIFTGNTYPEGEIERVYERLCREKENIVLIGMPASGKSTVGRILARGLSRRLIDTDELISESAGMEIKDIFEQYGEEHFRALECEAVRRAAANTGCIIATGGGAILRDNNVEALSENGRLYFIDRPLSLLIPTESRPLSSDRAAIERRYAERYDRYLATADVRVDGEPAAEIVAKTISEDFYK